MEKKNKKLNKFQTGSIEDSVLKFVARSMRKTIKRGYWGTGISLGFMQHEIVDQIGQMEQDAINELLNDPILRENILSQVGENLSKLVGLERNRRISNAKRVIADKERTRRHRAAKKKRAEKWKTDNARKIKAHKNLQKVIKEKLPKRYTNMLEKLAPELKNDIKMPKYNPYDY